MTPHDEDRTSRVRHWLGCLLQGNSGYILRVGLLLGLAGNTYCLAQPIDLRSAYDRSTRLVETDNVAGMLLFLDSLEHLQLRSENDKILYDLLRARWYRHSGRKLEAHHVFDSVRVDPAKHDPFLSYLLHYQHAKVYKDLEFHDEARTEALLASAAAQRNGMDDEVLEMDLLVCEIDLNAANYEPALEGFHRTLERSKARQQTEGICRALIGIGNVYYYQEEDSAALVYFKQAMDQAGGDPGLTLSAILNTGAAMSYTDGPEAAVAFYRAVLDTVADGEFPTMKADILSNLASSYSDLGEDDKALIEIDKALEVYGSAKDTASMAQAHLFKATALWNSGRKEQALDEVLLCRARTKSTDLRAKASAKAANYLNELGREREAYAMLSEYAALNDSLAKRKYSDGIAKAQIRFETVDKERRIAEQDKALQLAAAEDRRKSLQRNVSMGIAALLVVVAVLLWRGLQIRKRLAKKEHELHTRNVDQLLGQQEIKSINAMLEGQEKERDRLGKDLHDRLGSMLGGIKAQLGVLEDRVEQVQQDAQFKKVNRLLDETVGELRQISHDMAASTLSRFGLEKALTDLRNTIHISGRLAVELKTFGLEQRLERSVEIAVYRIVQELVSNVLKHAKANELSIAVTRTPGRLSVMVTDNGIGFDTGAPKEGMGLENVRSRAAALGGSLQVDSTSDAGTTVSVECPIIE